MSRKLLGFIFILCFTTNVAFASMGNVAHIFKYANQRFEMVRLLAAYKYVNHFPVDITVPELVELRNLYRYTHRIGLNVKSAHEFIIVNLLIGKNIQVRWIRKWQKQGLPQNEKIKELKTVIMPPLLLVDEKMIDSIVLAVPTLHDPKNLAQILEIAKKELTTKYLSKHEKEVFVKALLKIEMAKGRVVD